MILLTILCYFVWYFEVKPRRRPKFVNMVCEMLWFGLYPFDYTFGFDCNWFVCCLLFYFFLYSFICVQCVHKWLYKLFSCNLTKDMLNTNCTTDNYIFLYQSLTQIKFLYNLQPNLGCQVYCNNGRLLVCCSHPLFVFVKYTHFPLLFGKTI